MSFTKTGISVQPEFNLAAASIDNNNDGNPNSTMNAPATNQNTDHDDRCLFMSTTTWTRDSHELFDYEARQVHKKSYELKRAAKVFRTTLEVQVVPDGQSLPTQSADFLLSIREREGKFTVVPADRNLQVTPGAATLMPKKLWLIVKELPSANHQLQESDVIKLGRFKLRVKQLVKSGAALPELRLDDVETPHSIITPEEAATMQCRICLLEGGTADDPLLCPCQCRGSIKFVHLDCLRRWINGRLSLSDDTQQKASFFFKQLHCELCKSAFPSSVNLNNSRVPIVCFPKIDPPFIILENIVGNANRGLHVVSMNAKKELKLGRGHESDVRIADVSISRYHATIRFADGEFILEDHNSKFGTLVSLRKFQPVEETHPLAVQVGRTVLNFFIRKPSYHFEDVIDVNEDPVPQSPDIDPEDENARGGPQGGASNNYNSTNPHNVNMTNRPSGTSTGGGHPTTGAVIDEIAMEQPQRELQMRNSSTSRLQLHSQINCGREGDHHRSTIAEDNSSSNGNVTSSADDSDKDGLDNKPLLQQLIAYSAARNGSPSSSLTIHNYEKSHRYRQSSMEQNSSSASSNSFSQLTTPARMSSGFIAPPVPIS